jgi:hypothetical protein
MSKVRSVSHLKHNRNNTILTEGGGIHARIMFIEFQLLLLHFRFENILPKSHTIAGALEDLTPAVLTELLDAGHEFLGAHAPVCLGELASTAIWDDADACFPCNNSSFELRNT